MKLGQKLKKIDEKEKVVRFSTIFNNQKLFMMNLQVVGEPEKTHKLNMCEVSTVTNKDLSIYFNGRGVFTRHKRENGQTRGIHKTCWHFGRM